MSVSLKERCRKVISQQNLSGETARLFTEDVKDGALNAQTVRLLLDDMRRPDKAPAWLKSLCADAALNERDEALAIELLDNLFAIEPYDPLPEEELLQCMRLAALLMTASDAGADADAPAPTQRCDITAAYTVAGVFASLKELAFLQRYGQRPMPTDADLRCILDMHAAEHVIVAGFVDRCAHPDRYRLTPEDAAAFIDAGIDLENELQLNIPSLAKLAEMIISHLEKTDPALQNRRNDSLRSSLKVYLDLEERLLRRSQRICAAKDEIVPEDLEARTEKLAERAAPFTNADLSPEALLRSITSLATSGGTMPAARAAADFIQQLILNKTPPMASESAWQALEEKFAAGRKEETPAKKAGKQAKKSEEAELEAAMARILELRQLRRTGGADALLLQAQAAAQDKAPLANFEFVLWHSLLIAAAIESEAAECMDLALQMESRPEASQVEMSAEDARFDYWQCRRTIAVDDKSALGDVLTRFASDFRSESDPSVLDNYAENENRRMRTLFGRRSPAPDAERTIAAMYDVFHAKKAELTAASKRQSVLAKKKAKDELRTIAETFQSELQAFMPADRGLRWWSAAVSAQSVLAQFTHPKKDPAAFCRQHAALQIACEATYLLGRETARVLMPSFTAAQSVIARAGGELDRAGFDYDFLPWPKCFDLPWFPEIEKRLGRIIRHFGPLEHFSVIEVADAKDPDLVHLVTTCMSANLFEDTPGEDHEFFITISKKDAEPAEKSGKRFEALLPEAAPFSKLELGAILMLYTAYHSCIMSTSGSFQSDILITNRETEDGIDEPVADAHFSAASANGPSKTTEDYVHDKTVLPLVPMLPYKAIISCDDPEMRRVEPFQYGRGRTMTLTECIPLYAEELQYAADFSLEMLFARFGRGAFTPMRQTRENAAADFYKGELIPHDKLRNLLPEGVEDDNCFVDVRILQAGAAIDRCIHAESEDGETVWIFRSADAPEDDHFDLPDAWRRSTLSTICNYDAAVRPILSAPAGTAFKRSADGLFVRDIAYETLMQAIASISIDGGERLDAKAENVRETLQSLRSMLSGAPRSEEPRPSDGLSDEEIEAFWNRIGEYFDEGKSDGGENGSGRRDN